MLRCRSLPEFRSLLLFDGLVNGSDKIVVEFARKRIKPGPIFGNWFEDYRIAATPDAHLLAVEAEFLGKANRLGTA